ncbi:hypothetical protein L204_101354 [Cryptococcus depauperatus]|nr:hypothetical protein L204_04023 [Cryptococcus depauperatus CBS 7855]
MENTLSEAAINQRASIAEKRRREEHAQRAYDVQFTGGLQGAIKWTIFGAVACVVGHYTFPGFQRQTLGLKAFLTSSATIIGLVLGADDHLLRFEHAHRMEENETRRKARNALALEGKIASEGEIRRWREGYERKLAEDREREKRSLGFETAETRINAEQREKALNAQLLPDPNAKDSLQ